ncbi:MAG TPA: hypothetical protein VMW08_00380 [Acidimicrobiales bacterium]|nr:hypothetical protein [Acidimicrobiales bacterium]
MTNTATTTYWLVWSTATEGEQSIGFRNPEARQRFIDASTNSPHPVRGFRVIAQGETTR